MAGWFDTARFGMFVHWGHSSQQGIELSWPLVGGVFALPQCPSVPVAQYHASAATFDPQAYDPGEWARLARRCGMQYAILTAKHHDGYAMFETAQSDFSVMHSPYGRDIVRQFVDAMRREGLRVGLYFSLSDWHHPDYPAFTQADQPYRFPGKPVDPERWPRYVNFMFAQVRELLTSYGPIDVLWFDGGWERTPEQWRSRELLNMVRRLQPGILVNDRLPGCPADFATPEQFVPPQPLDRPWEVCMTINESWGYNAGDTRFKSARRLVHTLCEVAGRGGNLLLNVCPMGDGRLQPELVERLTAIEQWMGHSGESIAGTRPGLEPWQFYGPSTRRDGRVYLHLLLRPYDAVSVRGVRIKRVRSVRALSTGEELPVTARCSIVDQVLSPDPLGELTIEVPGSVIDPHATVLAVDFADGPE